MLHYSLPWCPYQSTQLTLAPLRLLNGTYTQALNLKAHETIQTLYLFVLIIFHIILNSFLKKPMSRKLSFYFEKYSFKFVKNPFQFSDLVIYVLELYWFQVTESPKEQWSK